MSSNLDTGRPKKSSSEGGKHHHLTWLWISIGVLALVAIVAGVVVFLATRRKKLPKCKYRYQVWQDNKCLCPDTSTLQEDKGACVCPLLTHFNDNHTVCICNDGYVLFQGECVKIPTCQGLKVNAVSGGVSGTLLNNTKNKCIDVSQHDWYKDVTDGLSQASKACQKTICKMSGVDYCKDGHRYYSGYNPTTYACTVPSGPPSPGPASPVGPRTRCKEAEKFDFVNFVLCIKGTNDALYFQSNQDDGDNFLSADIPYQGEHCGMQTELPTGAVKPKAFIGDQTWIYVMMWSDQGGTAYISPQAHGSDWFDNATMLQCYSENQHKKALVTFHVAGQPLGTEVCYGDTVNIRVKRGEDPDKVLGFKGITWHQQGQPDNDRVIYAATPLNTNEAQFTLRKWQDNGTFCSHL